MRKLLLSTALFGVLFACTSEQTQEVKSAKLSGTVEGMEDQTLLLRTGESVDTLKLDAQGMFSIEKNLEAPVKTTLTMGRKGVQLYLDGGFDLNIKTSKSEFSKSIEITGAGSEENNVLQADVKLLADLKVVPGMYKLPLDEFMLKSDSVMQAEIALISGKEESLSADFVELYITDIKYKHLNFYNVYERAHNYYTKEEVKLDDKALKIIEAGKVDSDKMASSSEYTKFMSSALENDFKKETGVEDYIENPTDFFVWLKTNVKSEKLRNEILYSNSKYTITYVSEEDRDQIYKTFSEINTNKEYQAKVDETYAKFENLRKGMDAPKWAYPTLEGENISLDDLKGKLVYIDVWATWCGPCKAEIPALAQLHEDYKGKDLAIVSVSVDDNKGAWEKMVSEEGFEWTQIHAEAAWQSEIIKQNQIRGIPRFMLVDKEGKIISVNAPRPSDEKIKEYIDALL